MGEGGRIVLSFRAAGGAGRSFLERARFVMDATAARGGELVAWDGTRFAVSLPANAVEDALGLAFDAEADTREDEEPWSIGVAQGELETVARVVAHGTLGWGRALVEASLLAGGARPGEVLAGPSLRALSELTICGKRAVREGGLRVRGVRLDPGQPWRRLAREHLGRMRVPRLLGGDLSRVTVTPGALAVLRADPGSGGTRLLTEIAERAPRALFVTPSGSGLEPLGSLRRAFGRSEIPDLQPVEIAVPLAKLMAGEGTALDAAARLVSVFLHAKVPEIPNVLVIDDATNVDPASLEACAIAAKGSRSFGIVARIDATNGLPPVLATLGDAREVEIAPLSQEGGEALASACANDALDLAAKKRFAKLGSGVPLGVVEAVAWGIMSGNLAWKGDVASPRSRVAGRGRPRLPEAWIRSRVEGESAACRSVLTLVAVLGGEAKIARLAAIFAAAGESISLEQTVAELVRGRWLVDTQEDWVALPSRTHKDTLANLVRDPSQRVLLHGTIASTIEGEEGVFGRVEAAFHAAQAGDGRRSSQMLLEAARRAADSGLAASTTQLIALARRVDPACEEVALEILASALEPAVSVTVPPDRPPIEALPLFLDHSTSELPPSEAPGSKIAVRLGELAKEALLASDNAALERWVDGLHAAGESPIFTERMRAMARLGRGDIGDALRVLKRTRQNLDPTDHALRCQTSLALGVALSVAGRAQEALLEGLDALGRARQNADETASRACLVFLAKLYASVERTDEGGMLLQAARG